MKVGLRMLLFNIFAFCGSIAIAQDSSYSSSSSLSSFTQNDSILEKIELIRLGDDVPDMEFTMVNYPKRIMKLSDFRGKLVILDFWATWCSACIAKFPELDSIQKIYKDRVQIILVNSVITHDTESMIKDFFLEKKNNLTGKPYNLPSTVGDSIAGARLFPYSSMVPYYVWINANGTLRAVTSSDLVSKDMIETVLSKIKKRSKN